MKLLVTGGAGYIGSIVAAHLHQAGHEIVVLDNLERGHRSAVPDAARLVIADLRDQAAVAAVADEGFDGVLHFAALALVGESVAHPERYYRTNLVGTLNLLDAMRAARVPRLVFSSTCAVYGQPDAIPIDETAPPRPANAYGASKLAVDRMISGECLAHGLGAVSLRYFDVAGASSRIRAPDLQPRQRQRLLGAHGDRRGRAGDRKAGGHARGVPAPGRSPPARVVERANSNRAPLDPTQARAHEDDRGRVGVCAGTPARV